MASVSFSSIRKSYGDTPVVHGFDLDIEDGEFIVLVGPSGCGKSTCLRMLAGLEEVTGGKLTIEGKVVNEETPGARDVAMVFQDYALYPHMSVAENLGFSIKNRGHRPEEVTRKVKNASDLLALDELLERKPKDLSGGQRQRVAMGRAIVRKPSVYLFDEPLSNLDAKLRSRMRQEIKKLHNEQKTTTIYVTHDQVEAMTLADRMVVMNAGRVEQIDRPREIYRNPTSKFVAEFIGSPTINMIPATVNHEGELLIGGEINVVKVETSSDFSGAELWLGVRQEDISVGLGTEPSNSSFTATVQVIEPLGPETLLFCEAADHEISARVSPDADFSEGDVVCLDMNLSNCTAFDRETEQRIPDLTDALRSAQSTQRY